MRQSSLVTVNYLNQLFTEILESSAGLYLNAYRTRAGLDQLEWPFIHTSSRRVVDKNQQGRQLELVNHLSLVIVLTPFLCHRFRV